MKVDNPLSARAPAPRPQKNRAPGVFAWAMTVSITAIVMFFVGARFAPDFGHYSAASGLDYSRLDAVANALAKNYDGKIDKNKLIDGAAAGMANSLNDPYTTFFTAADAKSFNSDLNGTINGIGAELGRNSDGQLEVISPIDGSPAKKAGLRAGDVIAKIDGKDSLALDPDAAVGKIRGKVGTLVKLGILRDGQPLEFTITRAKIAVPSVRWKISDDGGKTWIVSGDTEKFALTASSKNAKIGYIQISQFADDTADLATKAATALKQAGVKGVILDLRGDGGGYVDAAVSVSSLWLKQGQTVVKEVGKNNQVLGTETATGDPILDGVKTVVLIDGGSASASEITAAALHDNAGATLVGQKSYGKGVMQDLIDLDGGAQLKVTTARWFTPAGKNIQGGGIKPDREVKLTEEQLDRGDDTQLTAAVQELAK